MPNLSGAAGGTDGLRFYRNWPDVVKATAHWRLVTTKVATQLGDSVEEPEFAPEANGSDCSNRYSLRRRMLSGWPP